MRSGENSGKRGSESRHHHRVLPRGEREEDERVGWREMRGLEDYTFLARCY